MEKTTFKKSIRWVIGSVLLILVLTLGYPIFRNSRALNRLHMLGGDFYSQHHWYIEELPWQAQNKLKSICNSIRGSGARSKYQWAGPYKKIQGYDLRGTAATEEDLELLLRDQNFVWWLWLEGAQVDCSESFRHLSGRILYIEAEDTLLNDEAIRHLVNLDQLETLNLKGTKVTDRSLPYLIRIPGMKSIRLPASFSEEATQKLQKAKPKCYVRREK